MTIGAEFPIGEMPEYDWAAAMAKSPPGIASLPPLIDSEHHQALEHAVAELTDDNDALRRAVAAVRALHVVVTTPAGDFCDHCCLNRLGDRRFSCYRHEHHRGSAACPTLAVLGE